MNQELKEIFLEIANAITHDYDKDIKYIAKQIKAYENHSRNGEIVRSLGVLYYDLLPKNRKHELVKVMEMDDENVLMLFYISQWLISDKEYDKALDILQIITKEIAKWEMSDGREQYFSFDNMIELFLYGETSDSKKEIKRSKYPVHEMYRAMAAIHFKHKRYEEAADVLQHGLLHNPVDVDLLLDIAEVSSILQDSEQYLLYSKEALRLAYEVEPIARSYRNIGNYYLQEGDFETAITSYYMSLMFDKHDITLKALYSIYEITKQELEAPDLADMKEVLDGKQIQVGASTLVVDTLLQLAKEFDEVSERSLAIEYLEKAHRITNDDSLLPIIEEMKLSA